MFVMNAIECDKVLILFLGRLVPQNQLEWKLKLNISVFCTICANQNQADPFFIQNKAWAFKKIEKGQSQTSGFKLDFDETKHNKKFVQYD